jgi:hypothetical protein
MEPLSYFKRGFADRVKNRAVMTVINQLALLSKRCKGKGKVIPLQARCGPEGGYRYSSTSSSTRRPHFAPGKDPIPILQEAGWAPGPVWTDAENLVPTGIRSRTDQTVVSCYTERATGPISKRCVL